MRVINSTVVSCYQLQFCKIRTPTDKNPPSIKDTPPPERVYRTSYAVLSHISSLSTLFRSGWTKNQTCGTKFSIFFIFRKDMKYPPPLHRLHLTYVDLHERLLKPQNLPQRSSPDHNGGTKTAHITVIPIGLCRSLRSFTPETKSVARFSDASFPRPRLILKQTSNCWESKGWSLVSGIPEPYFFKSRTNPCD